MKGVFDYLICDEVHEEKSDTSARANALGALVASCRKVVAMTGTLIGGKASHVRSLLFRLSPKSLKAENLCLGRRHGIRPPLRPGGYDRHGEDQAGKRQPPQQWQEHVPSGRPSNRASCRPSTAGT